MSKAAILGCGAMGTVMGAYMVKNGFDIDFVDSYQAHIDVLNNVGARVTGFADMTVPVKAITPDQMDGIYDLIFLFTKQTVNDVVLPKLLPHLSKDSTVCTLQNGVPEPYVAEYVGRERTVGGTVLWGATFLEPGVSELTQDIAKNDHLFEIGEMDGRLTARIKEVARVLGYMGKAKVTERLMGSRWGKLVNNACMSGMSAACGSTYGVVLENDKSRACLSYLAREVKSCCEADGITMPTLLNEFSPELLPFSEQEGFNRSQRMFLDMYEGMHTAKASMLQDLENGKPTEVKMINGYVCQTGDRLGIETPFNDKVVEIVTKIEQGALPLSFSNISCFEDSMFKY